MSASDPRTVQEWQEYISTLYDEDLFSKAKAANQILFVRRLQEEDGLEAPQIQQVFEAFARRFLDLERHPPGGAFDLSMMMKSSEVATLVLPTGIVLEPILDECDDWVDKTDLESAWEGDVDETIDEDLALLEDEWI